MATPAQRTNTWTLDEWYDQAVAGTQGDFIAGGQLWSWGNNTRGQLGQNDGSANARKSSPTQVGTDTNWNKIGKGPDYDESWFRYCIKSDSTLWGWGYNADKGNLGLNDRTNRSSPTQVPGAWNKITSNNRWNLAIKTDGSLWSWGYANTGNLGQWGPDVQTSSPVQVPGFSSGNKATACNNNSAHVIKTDGTMWTWGDNAFGPQGMNDRTDTRSPRQVGTDTTWADCAAGQKSIVATKTDGTLWGWGVNDNGSSGHNAPNNSSLSSPTQIGTGTDWNPDTLSRGRNVAGCIKTDGSLYVWGRNQQGMMGINDIVNRSSPIQLPGTYSKVSMGYQAAGFIKTDGTLWSAGYNGPGVLGQNTGAPGRRSSPVQVGSLTTWRLIFSGSQDTMLAIK